MEEIDIRFTLRTPEEVEKFNIVKDFLKISTNTKVLAFLINEKFQEIQKLDKNTLIRRKSNSKGFIKEESI